MDAEQIRQLRPRLKRFLKRFADCFGRKDTRAHLPVYVRGQLSDLPEKSVEPIALAAGVAPRTLQEFLSQLQWDEEKMRDRLQHIVVTDHAGAHALGIFAETSDAKKGDKTPGVQKQWCGRLGKTENCIVTVHLGYALDDFHCLLDGELYVPQSWADDRMLNDRRLRKQPWQRWRIRDGAKGPQVWECKHVWFYPKDENGLPGEPLHLLSARNVLDPSEIKFFISNAPAGTSVGTLLRVAFSRWRAERCFQDQKSEIGLDQYEGRRYLGLKRHLILSSVSYLFLALVRQEWRGEKPGADSVPTPHRHGGAGAFLVAERRPGFNQADRQDSTEDHETATPERAGAEEPCETYPEEVAQVRHQTHRAPSLPVGYDLAL